LALLGNCSVLAPRLATASLKHITERGFDSCAISRGPPQETSEREREKKEKVASFALRALSKIPQFWPITNLAGILGGAKLVFFFSGC
jgi:hypothetical protein